MENSDTELVKLLNLDQICRICLAECDSSIYSSCASSGISYFDILQRFSFIQNHEITIPSKLCSKCTNEIDRMFLFKKLCESSEIKLKAHFESVNKFDKTENENINKANNKNIKNDFVIVEKQQKSIKYRCKICNIYFDSKMELLQHGKTTLHSKKRLFSCSICKIVVPSSEVKLHAKLHKIVHICKYCNRNFTSPYNLRRHLLTHTGERPYKCEVCSKSFTRAHNLSDHTKLHSGQTKCVCSFCGKIFFDDALLRTHLHTHDTETNQCEICDLEFPSADTLLQHLQTHENDGKLLCKLCGKVFEKIRPYRIHMKKHADKNGKKFADSSYNYECKYCLRAFQSKATLNNHQLTHGEKLFLCSDCGKGFISWSQLQTHMRTHTGDRPFCCQFCTKTFAQRSSLSTHSLLHSGAKPYVCTVCAKAFTQSHHRKRHMLVHSGERPFPCTICSKKFAQKENFTVHMRLHTGETPFACSVCAKRFYDSSSMNKHKKCHSNS